MTLREITYAIKERLSINSDDLSFDLPDELLFEEIPQVRSKLIKQRYSDQRKEIPAIFYQTLCVHMKVLDNITGTLYLPEKFCTGSAVRSEYKIPNIITFGLGYRVHTVQHQSDFNVNVNWVELERLPYVGRHRFIKDQVYLALGYDRFLYAKSDNPEYLFIDRVQLSAVLDNPADIDNPDRTVVPAYSITYNCDGDTRCSFEDKNYPMDGDMTSDVIDIISQKYLEVMTKVPEDQINNADESDRA